MIRLYKGDTLLWPSTRCADTPLARLRGLLGRRSLQPGEALLIRPCNQVHTLHMRFALDVLYLDARLRILRIDTLPPNRLGVRVHGATCVLEVAAGEAARLGLRPGDQLSIP